MSKTAMPRRLKARERFDQLYSGWLNARAASEDPRLPEDDESAQERADRRDAAARTLLAEPVTLPWMIWRKWEVLESFMEIECVDDGFRDRRVVAALGILKADLSALGIGCASRED
jgi:hypothetical protein